MPSSAKRIQKPKPAGQDDAQKKPCDLRTERLADALVGAYLVECRQEVVVGKDDTPPDMPIFYDVIDPEAITAFSEYEERGVHGRLLSHFVTCIVEGYSAEDDPTDRGPSKSQADLVGEINPEDLALFHWVETAEDAWAKIEEFYDLDC